MADENKLGQNHSDTSSPRYEKSNGLEEGRRRSSVVDLNRGKNLEAK